MGSVCNIGWRDRSFFGEIGEGVSDEVGNRSVVCEISFKGVEGARELVCVYLFQGLYYRFNFLIIIKQ